VADRAAAAPNGRDQAQFEGLGCIAEHSPEEQFRDNLAGFDGQASNHDPGMLGVPHTTSTGERHDDANMSGINTEG
jgi:hypothetical protein